MFEGFQEKTVIVDGIDIACVVGGSGPPVLMLHGFPQNRAMWAKVAPRLARTFTVVCADLRGYGASSKPPCAADNANYSFRAMAKDQVGLMRFLGFERFHLVGHDRGARVGHRMALDHPQVLESLTVMDIVPTSTMFLDVTYKVAASYWHWYFLQQPAPFPETMIAGNPDFFYETCLLGWGATGIEAFDQEMLAAYRKSWRDKAMIHGSCSDYRAAATVDLEHDELDRHKKVQCPTLVMYGAKGQMAQLFDLPAQWRQRCLESTDAHLPGGHFFVDQFPDATSGILHEFLFRQAKAKTEGRPS